MMRSDNIQIILELQQNFKFKICSLVFILALFLQETVRNYSFLTKKFRTFCRISTKCSSYAAHAGRQDRYFSTDFVHFAYLARS